MNIVQESLKTILSFSSDVVVIATLVVLGTIYALSMGKRRIVSLILSFYPAAVIFRYLPALKYTASNPAISTQIWAQIGLFLLVLIPIHLILNQYIATEFHFMGARKLIDSLLLGAVVASLVILFSYQVVNLQTLYNFGSGVDALFTGNLVLIWLIAPFLILYGTRE